MDEQHLDTAGNERLIAEDVWDQRRTKTGSDEDVRKEVSTVTEMEHFEGRSQRLFLMIHSSEDCFLMNGFLSSSIKCHT